MCCKFSLASHLSSYLLTKANSLNGRMYVGLYCIVLPLTGLILWQATPR